MSNRHLFTNNLIILQKGEIMSDFIIRYFAIAIFSIIIYGIIYGIIEINKKNEVMKTISLAIFFLICTFLLNSYMNSQNDKYSLIQEGIYEIAEETDNLYKSLEKDKHLSNYENNIINIIKNAESISEILDELKEGGL